VRSAFLRIFPAANKRSAQEIIDQSQKRRILRRVSGSISKLVSNFKEANKNHQHTESADYYVIDL
jgi:hypothetical protein